MRTYTLLALLTLIFTSAQASNSGRTPVAWYYLTSEFFPELALFQNTDQTYQWVLIDSNGEKINVNTVELSENVASIHFDQDDTHIVTFELQSPTQNGMAGTPSLAMLIFGLYFLPNKRNS